MSHPPAVEATPAPGPDDAPLSAAQVSQWREEGFALVDGVLPAALLSRLQADALAVFPRAGTAEARTVTDFGAGPEFPSATVPSLNDATLHPRLLAAVGQLLGVPPSSSGVRLSQSVMWPKYGREERADAPDCDNDSQRMHMDFPNHTLTHPPPWDTPEAVEMIVYLSDSDRCGGSTGLVPRAGPEDPAYAWPYRRMPGFGALRYVNSREAAEAYLATEAPEVAAWRAEHLYPREKCARFRPGTVLLYRHDLWHRGRPLLPGAERHVLNMTFRRAASEWVSTLQAGTAWGMYRPSLCTERLVAAASVEQRAVLGFPAPGHPHWTAEMLDAVEARYGPLGMDMSPYRDALA